MPVRSHGWVGPLTPRAADRRQRREKRAPLPSAADAGRWADSNMKTKTSKSVGTTNTLKGIAILAVLINLTMAHSKF